MTKSSLANGKRKVMLFALASVLCLALVVGIVCAIPQSAKGEGSFESIESVTLKTGAVVYSNDDATTVKGALNVVGKIGDESLTVPVEDFTVELPQSGLAAGESAEITVKLVGVDSPAEVLTVDVADAEVGAVISAKKGYDLSGDYYINADGYYAFTCGMTAEQVESRLAIKIVSKNPRVESVYADFDGTSVKWDGPVPDFGVASSASDKVVSVSLSVTGVENIEDGTISGDVVFAQSKTVGLQMLDGWSQPNNITPTSTIQSFIASLQGYVVAVLNNGLSGSTINVETDLNYGGLYVGATAAALESCSKGDTFYKTLEIPSAYSDVSPLIIKNLEVTYSEFVRIGEEIQGDQLPPQTARSEKLQYGDLYLNVYFKNERNTNTATRLYLKDLPVGEVTTTYYDESNNPESSLTRNVKVIVITYQSDKGTATREFEGVQISPMTVSAPTIKDTELTYSDAGCSTEVEGLLKDDPAYGDDMIISSVSDGAEVAADGKTISFNHGGKFTVTVTFKNITEGRLSDFVFQQGSGNGEINSNDPTIVTYTVNVLKAPITISLNGFNSEYQYGDSEPNYTVRGEVKDSDSMKFDAPKSNNLKSPALPLPDGYVLPAENEKTLDAPSFVLYYTGTLAVAREDGTTDYASYDFPEKRGTYSVHIITAETGWYDAGVLETPYQFDIVERRLSLGDITIPSVKYERGKSYTLDDVLQTVTVGNLVNPDDKNSVLDWAFESSTAPQHAGNYNINFKIKNKNYKWDGTEDLTKQAVFKIEALTLGLNVTLSGGSFVYGNVNPDPQLTRTRDGVTVDSYYAIVSDAKYYKVVDGTETLMSGNDFNNWDVGNYKVKYTTSVDTDDSAGDYNLPETEAAFTITPKQIKQVKLDNTSSEYNNGDQHFALINSDGNGLNASDLVNGQTYAGILTVTLDSAVLQADRTTAVATARMSYSDCVFTAIDAADYTYKVALNSNYTWGGTKNTETGLEEITLTFEITQAPIEIKWAEKDGDPSEDWNNAINYTYDGNAHYPVLSAQEGLTLSYHFAYSDGSQTVKIEKEDIKDAKTYWVRVTGFTGEALTGASYTLAVNYSCSATEQAPLDKSFVIVSQGLDIPALIASGEVSGNLVTVVYNGLAVDFTSFIDDYSNKYLLNGTPKITIKFDGSAVSPKNVKGTDETEGEYTVTVTPAGNFKWASGDETETKALFRLKITRLPIVISWDDNSFANYVYNGKAQTVALGTNYTLNKQADDDIDVTFTYSGDKITDGEAINAGDYTVTLNGVTGTAANNYTVTNAQNTTHSLEISPFKIAAPVFADNVQLTFNGNRQNKEFTLTDYSTSVTGFDWNGLLGIAISGDWNFDGVNKVHNITYEQGSCFEISRKLATFTFTNAGTYSFTFSIVNSYSGPNNVTNYVWEDGAITELSFTVQRATVKAPDLLESRAMEWDKTITELGDSILSGNNVRGITYTVLYGTRLSETLVTDTVQANIDRNSEGKGKQGQYFAQLTISGANAWNYVWEVLPDGQDSSGNKIFLGGTYIEGATVPYSSSYNDDCGAQVQLFYAITAGQVEIAYQINNYTFGANGVTKEAVLDEVVKMTTTDGIPTIASTVINFYVSGTTDTNRVALSGNQLVNSLPWNKGVYDVEIVITFAESDKYTNWTSSGLGLTLTVSARPINVEWKFGDSSTLSTTYNGTEQNVTATITNIPKSGVDAIDNNVDASLALTYKLNGAAATPKNAGVYAVEVSEITGADAGNYTLTDGSGLSCEFTINKIEVTVDATAVNDHIYGNVIKEAYGQLYTVSAGAFLTGEDKIITKIMNNGVDYDPRKDPVGTYTVMPTWNGTLPTLSDGVYTIDADNYLITVTTADFKVVARTVTVSFKGSNAASVYGSKQNVDLYNPAVYNVTWTADGDTWNVGNDKRENVFTLTSGATADYAAAGTYYVTLNVVANNNYIVKVGESTVTDSVKLGEFTITEANITIKKVEGYNGVYDGNLHDMFVLDATPVNGQELTWYYQVAGDTLNVDGAWTEYTSQQIKNVKDSGTYYIKVEAPNHNPAYYNVDGGKVNVTVTKKEVTVQVNLSIQFGEAAPDTVKYLMSKADLKLANYVFGANGLCEGLDDVDGLTVVADKLLYTVTGYEQGVTGVNDTKAVIRFNPDALTADNYTFANLDGQLTVTQLVLEVLIKNATNVYRQTYGDVTFETEITLPKSTYNVSEEVTLTGTTLAHINAVHSQGYKGANIFTLKTAAFADTNGATYTKNVGSYDITGAVNEGVTNYNATFKGEADGSNAGVHTITPAQLTVQPDIKGYQKAYDEKYHELLYVLIDGNIEVALDKFAQTTDGEKVLIQFYVKNLGKGEVFEDNSSADTWAGFTGVSGVNPTAIDVCHAAVYYRLYVESGNYESYYGAREARISEGTNSFTNETALNIDGWTYGLYDAINNENGFNATITDPVTAFNSITEQDHANTLKVTLTRNGGAIEGLTGEYNTISALFDYMWNNGLFSVGNYVLTLTMDKTDNYGELTKDIAFTVAAKELVITAKDQTVVYGNDFETGYTFDVAGLVKNSTNGSVETQEIAFAGMNTNFFTTAYAKGRVGGSVGNYAISTTANAIANKGNYTFKYVVENDDRTPKVLTVTPREVTVTIDDYTNIYNDDEANLATELKFNVANGSLGFADGDSEVIVLRTLAIAGFGIEASALSARTNNVIVASRNAYGQAQNLSAYPVYAVFGANAKGEGKTDYNYVIKFSGCSYTNALENYQSACDAGKTITVIAEGDTPIAGGAGSYKIERATIGITYDGVHHMDGEEEINGRVYSGAVNYYKATTTDSSVQMTFKYGYNKTERGNYVDIDADQVVNAGYYIAYGRLTSDNYYDSNANQLFEITKATVTLTAEPTSVQYGTTLSGNPKDENARFGGFTYTYDKGALLQSVYDEYVDAHPVTYTTVGYTAKTAAGTDNVTIVPVCESSDNITISPVSAALTVSKREVTVTVYGYGDNANKNDAGAYLAQCDYLGTAALTQAKLEEVYKANWSKFVSVEDQGDSGDGLDALKISFSLVNAFNANADGYGMSVTSGNSNYSVKFKTAAGEELTEIESDSNDAPKFVINKAKLTIYANAIVNNGVADRYSIIYGNNVTSVNWTYYVDGMQGSDNFATLLSADGQTIEYSRTCGGKEFEAWKSTVGEEYEVVVKTLNDLDNYDLVNSQYKPAKLTIEKRTISVATENQTFTWDGSNNGGAYGISHEAVLTYSDTLTANNSAINNNINVVYRPKNTGVKYSTVANSSYNQAANAAPTRVGDYDVTVTLYDNNYKFENGSETVIKFSVTQREVNELNLRWNSSTVSWNDGENFSAANSIEKYLDYVMEVVLFTFTPYGSSGSRVISSGNAETPNTYYFDGQKLTINATERGRYEVRFKLRDSALWNYKLISSNETLVVSAFVISSSTLDMTLEIADWTYNTTPNAPQVTVNGASVSGVEFSYARVTDVTNIADYYGNGENGKGQLSSIGTLPISSYTSINAITFNAGYYVVRATYWGTVADSSDLVSVVEYFVFKVEKAIVNMPTAEVENYTFNGQEQSLAIEYLTNLVRASYDGRTSINDNGIDVFATDAKTYTVTFTLVDSANYEWSEGGIEAYELSWTISKDESPNSDSNILTIGTKDFESTFGSVAVTGETVADGYVSNVSRYYVAASENMDFDTIDQWASDVEWINGLPANVGNYFVKLVLNGNSNFSDKETYVKLEVVPYVIEVSASGTITYGNGNWQAAVRYEDVTSPYGHRVTGTATYSLVGDYGTLQAGGEYYVIADHDENGVALGLTMSNNAGANYVIKAVQGRLTVNKRDVTVTLGNASSQYGRAIDLTDVSVVYGQGQLVAGDSLNLTPYVVDVENAVNVGGYIINATYDNDNYNVTINPGTYTITARRITIEVVQGGGTYGGEINPVNLTKVLDDQNVDIKAFVESNNLVLDIYYVGLANDNTSYNSTVKPSKAGTYTATVRGSDNDNFVIIGEVSTSFVINKKPLDGSLITIANQTYTGSALTPVLNSDEFVALYGDNLFEEVVRSGEFVNAGSYTVTLRIKDFANYKWQSVEIFDRNYTFVIDKANNELTSDIIIAGWAYGEYSVDSNLPSATVKFGQSNVTFLYSDSINGTYTSGAPATGKVGDYWVKVSVPVDDNYNAYTSDPVKFAITKRALVKPTLTIITEGEGKNDTYTGEQLVTAIVGYDMALMNLVYDDINVNGGQIIARATNAGIYEIKLSIADTHNYCWQGESESEITLIWTIAPKAIAKPTENTSKFIVNGKVLTYIPEGFDEETMTISGNETAYGGNFPVTIGLKDKSNYVWAEGGTDEFTLTWNVVGINTVFIIVASVLGGASAIALITLGIQLIRDKRRRRLIDLAIDARSQAEAMKAPSKPQEQTDGKADEKKDEGGND